MEDTVWHIENSIMYNRLHIYCTSARVWTAINEVPEEAYALGWDPQVNIRKLNNGSWIYKHSDTI